MATHETSQRVLNKAGHNARPHTDALRRRRAGERAHEPERLHTRLRAGLPALLLACLITLSACGLPTRVAAGDLKWDHQAQVVGPLPSAPRGDPVAECDQRRAALAQRLPGPGVIFLRGAEAVEQRFYQQDDVWYLSNLAVADIALAIVIDEHGQRSDELLWLPPYSARWEIWNGSRPAPGAEAERATGFARTAPLPSGEDGNTWGAALSALGGGTLYLLDPDAAPTTSGLHVDDSGALRAALSASRLVKSSYEIDCLTNAIDITVAALHQAYSVAREGMWEYQAQAAIDGTYLRLGSERPGFPSICGTGPSTTALHYQANRRRSRPGELLLMDVGAEYRGYCADVTRTIPLSGRFSPRQREIYELVLEAQRAAEAIAVPGVTMSELHQAAADVFTEAGLRQHFKHSVGHWIGLDVHDVSDLSAHGSIQVPIVENTLFTIEPGLYLADEELGVRIEDDYLMTSAGIVKLSAGIPSDPDAIEALMAALR